MGSQDYFAPGQWNFNCQQCGRKLKSGEGLLEWDGLRVCRDCIDPRHPQELVRPVQDPKPIPWSAQSADLFVTPTYQTSHSLNGMPFNFWSID